MTQIIMETDNIIDWDDPAARYALVERVGHEEYNRLINEFLNNNPVRPVNTRYGVLYTAGNTGMAFRTREEAESHLAKATGKETV